LAEIAGPVKVAAAKGIPHPERPVKIVNSSPLKLEEVNTMPTVVSPAVLSNPSLTVIVPLDFKTLVELHPAIGIDHEVVPLIP